MWFHPENLYAEWPRLENVVATFLEELGALVRNGDLRCVTMGTLAEEFRSKFTDKQNSEHAPVHSQAPCAQQPVNYGVGGAS